MSENRQSSEISSRRVPTLKKRSDFLRLRAGKKASARTIILQSAVAKDASPECATPRVGYTVTKKVGNSVVRNRIKRRLRAAASEVFPKKAMPSREYVIIGKHGALTQSFSSILKDLEQALDHVHKNRSKGANPKTIRDQKPS